MKRIFLFFLVCLMFTGCSVPKAKESAAPEPSSVTEIVLSDDGIQVIGGAEAAAVLFTKDIIYYEDKETYASGNPYGEGTPEERHTAEEAAAHTVVNITKPGSYRIEGKLSAGQIRVDLGKDACEDPNAVVKLILDNADITCTVAPAILFLNVYECDEDASEKTATTDVDTSAAGANLILEGRNIVNGSHVAKIFKDKDEEKKLWKQDAAIYSYMSMNVEGPGSLEITADNEGLDTELHLTINSGDITICSGNDGINTNKDGVSVTTINGGNVTIFAGLGAEGDGIDSNGYLVINGGNVFSCAKPISDAGLDSDLGSYIHGGTVIAMGSTMDWAESNSRQVTMNLQFSSQQKAGSKIIITREDGTEIFSFDTVGEYARGFSGLVLSDAAFKQRETYNVYIDGIQMAYTGTDIGRGHGGFGGRPGGMPEGFEPGQMDNRTPRPEGMMAPKAFEDKQREKMEPPEEFEPSQFFNSEQSQSSEARTDFHMNDKVNAFSFVSAIQP